MSFLCITVRFLRPYFHGRGEGGGPEWPPSPLRVFQAMVASVARQGADNSISEENQAALRWLEQQAAPSIIAPAAAATKAPYRLYVPDNVSDKMAGSWSRGGEASIAGYRTEKDVRAIHLPDEAEVHYLYPLEDGTRPPLETLAMAARSISHVGWGVDMATANASIVSKEETETLSNFGEKWTPSRGGHHRLRTMTSGTLDDLVIRHTAFLNRLGRDDRGAVTFCPVPPLCVFRTNGYQRDSERDLPSISAFSLLQPNAEGFRVFDTVECGLTVAGMMRHATAKAAKTSGWTDAKTNDFVLGHFKGSDPNNNTQRRRFAYLPLPSIEFRGPKKQAVVGAIRRVMVTAYAEDCIEDIEWTRRALSGQNLIRKQDGESVALLSTIPTNDKMVKRYTQPAATWATVTPVVLPGYDDPGHLRRRMKDKEASAQQKQRLLERLNQRIDGLLRKAIIQAGFSSFLAKHARLEWRTTGFWPGNDLANRYGVPDHLKKLTRYHVCIVWQDAQGKPLPVSGPICFGGGRYYGLGLFAALPQN